MSAISKILDWAGFRTMATWFTSVINSIWNQEKNSALQTVYNTTSAVNVTMQDNVEVFAPMLAQNTSGNAYGNKPQWKFREGVKYPLGQTVTISNVSYVVPSIVTDADGNSHIVYPRWMAVWDGHYFDANGDALAAQYEDSVYAGTDANAGRYFCSDLSDAEVWKNYVFGFHADPDFTYHSNQLLLGTGLDGYDWASILTQTAAAISGTETTITVTSATGLLVGQFIRFKNEDADVVGGGYIKAIDQTSVTIAVVLGATSVTEIEAYMEV